MLHVRPHRIFSLLKDPPSARIFQGWFPWQQGTGGITMLENALLICALRIVKARRAFEFGTFFGRTALNLALNLPDDGEVFTLDLLASEADAARNLPDLECARSRANRTKPLDCEGHPAGAKIKFLTGNSRIVDLSALYGSMDLVWIDGGHDIETVKSDTENALRLTQGRLSCIGWHDYGNPNYPELESYLDSLPRLIHAEDSYLCLRFSDLYAELAAG
jgi:hypothetical protein